MPRWLERLLPHINIEGAEFFKARGNRDPLEASEPERKAMAGAAAS
jgi:hypothetical protein